MKQENFLDLYVWFAPEVTGNVQQYAIQNYKLDGKLSWTTNSRYARADMSGGAWAWYTDAEKNGMTITEPYEWEGFEDLIVSICLDVRLNGKHIGVVGSDIPIGEFRTISTPKNPRRIFRHHGRQRQADLSSRLAGRIYRNLRRE